jgi:single-stranded-DNA-specific exonuclease
MPTPARKRIRPQWRVAEPFDGVDDLARRAGLAPLTAQVLANRGITDPDAAGRFLSPKLNDLHDPADLPGVEDAARRIAQAAKAGEPIVIYGDYDVDGMTAVAILDACLSLAEANVTTYVPHRLEEGFVTVDCGIGAVDAVADATAAGADVIITDHHAPPQQTPDATAIVHPDLPGASYPFPMLAGAGVAFKLAWQVARELCGSTRVDEPMRRFLLNATCLAALGTIADVVPLVDENRVLAVHGLTGLPHADHPGLQALIKASGLDGEKLDAYHVGFVLAPRLNAAGRMGHAQLALDLLTGRAGDRCAEAAEYLNAQNADRQKVERAITAEAVGRVESEGLAADDRRGIVLASTDWHGGVVGIVASRLVDRFNRPAVVIAINGDGIGQGSCRSVAGLHMREALDACAEHLIGFGGHAMAAGLRVDPANLPAFADAFVNYANTNLTAEAMAPELTIDAETTLPALTYDAAEQLTRLAPFGRGNPEPVVAIRNCQLVTEPRRMGQKGQTLGLMLSQNGKTIRAVGFGMGYIADGLAGVRSIDVAAAPNLNTFRGRTNVELKLKDVVWE